MAQGVEHKAHNNRIQRLRLSLKFLIYLFGTGHFLKPEEAFRRQVKSLYPSYLLNEASDKDNHYYGEYNLTHKA